MGEEPGTSGGKGGLRGDAEVRRRQRQLDPNSANDNIHAGVMYLKRLITDAGGDENAAIAGYYQGLASVQHRGAFDDTQRYVANVQALRSRFGG